MTNRDTEPLVCQDSVFAAADRLVASGQAATIRAVREELGGGSHKDIAPLLRVWRRGRADAPPADGLDSLADRHPDFFTLVEGIAGTMAVTLDEIKARDAAQRDQLVAALQQAADGQAQQLRRDFAARLHDATEAERRAVAEADGLRQELAQMGEDLAERRAAAAAAEERAEAGERRCHALTGDLDRAEREAQLGSVESRRLGQHVEMLNQLIGALRADLAHERDGKDKLHHRIEDLVAQLAEARARTAPTMLAEAGDAGPPPRGVRRAALKGA